MMNPSYWLTASYLSSVLLLAGCAAPKPILQDADYPKLAGLYQLGEACAAQGLIDVSTAAKGQLMIKQKLGSYSFDPAKVQSAEGEATRQIKAAGGAPQELCNKFALEVAKEQQIRDQRAAEQQAQADAYSQAAQAIQQSTPKTTYCNKIGTQVICNTY